MTRSWHDDNSKNNDKRRIVTGGPRGSQSHQRPAVQLAVRRVLVLQFPRLAGGVCDSQQAFEFKPGKSLVVLYDNAGDDFRRGTYRVHGSSLTIWPL